MVRRALFVGALLAVAAAVAVPLAVFAIGDGEKTVTREDYLAQVNAICRRYEARLQRVPPPANPANPLIVKQSVGKALPLVEQRVEEIRAVEPPEAMRAQVTKMLAAADDATAALRAVLVAANAGNVPRVANAFGAFLVVREAARAQSTALGITC